VTIDRALRSVGIGAATALAMALSVGLARSAPAQRRNRPAPTNVQLELVRSLNCTFTVSATGSWMGSDPQVDVKKDVTDVTIAFKNIDSVDGTAERVAAKGDQEAEVTVKLMGSNLHILDITRNGVAITTVFSAESENGKLQAVHSRMMLAPNATTEPVAAQYYGDCVMNQPAP
jgi:hypothetical protein